MLTELPYMTTGSLKCVQNAAASLITGSTYRYSTSPILKQLQWLSVNLCNTLLEKVQRTALKMIDEFRGIHYVDILRKIGLSTLET